MRIKIIEIPYPEVRKKEKGTLLRIPFPLKLMDGPLHPFRSKSIKIFT